MESRIEFFETKREKLMTERNKILDRGVSYSAQGRNGDKLEIASNTADMQIRSSLSEHLKKRLKSIEAGLEALTNGTYHKCITCGGDIEMERMENDTVLFPQECLTCLDRRGEKST